MDAPILNLLIAQNDLTLKSLDNAGKALQDSAENLNSAFDRLKIANDNLKLFRETKGKKSKDDDFPAPHLDHPNVGNVESISEINDDGEEIPF